jgi:cell shape-determining protein MreC
MKSNSSLGSAVISTPQRDLARVKYYRDLIQQQMFEYQRVRLEEEHFEQELTQLNN